MKYIIQCAGSKSPQAGSFEYRDVPILFTADGTGPADNTKVFAKPTTNWTNYLETYNAEWEARPQDNPYRLLPAYQLYQPSVYRELVDKFGLDRVFILSAGWGLVRASFLLPHYDITFAQVPQGERYKHRTRITGWSDLNQLDNLSGVRIKSAPDAPGSPKVRWYNDIDQVERDFGNRGPEPVTFIGGKSYYPLLNHLLKDQGLDLTVWYAGMAPNHSELPGGLLNLKEWSPAGTNWHYRLAQRLIAEIPVPEPPCQSK